MTPPTIIVGAGIIGAAIAFTLQQRGHKVLVLDRGPPGRGASFGNMASIAVTEFLPVSRPAVWKQIPGWLRDPEGPIRLRPSYLPRLAPWLLRFAAAGMPARVRQIEQAGATLSQRVYDDLLPMLDAAGLTDMLSTAGGLSLYAEEREFAADRGHLALLDRYGFEHQVLEGDALRACEPALGPIIRKAVLLPQKRGVRDPYRLVLALLDRVRAMGGDVASGDVVDFERAERRVIALRLADGRRIAADSVVLCAGVHTAPLAARLGETIPLETERGYHTQIMVPGITLGHALIWPARGFMVSPTAGGVRVGGSVEIAGLDAPPDFRRAKVLVRHAQQALPGLACEDATEWMGHRPALPDTIPIISQSTRSSGVFYATGHGHLGLTYAATTARLIADLVTGATPPIDITPYRINRFRYPI